jgi:vitamin B12 transporter
MRDLYYPVEGNPSLRPEKLRSNELGLQYSTKEHDVRAVWFSNQYTDLIDDQLGFFGDTLKNIDGTHNEGLEVKYRGKFGATTVSSGVTLQNPVDKFNQRLARRASTLANLAVTHNIGSWSYGANLRFVGERTDFYTDPNLIVREKTLASYTVVDLTVSQRLNRTIKLFGRIENLFDERYETVFGYNQARLGVFVGLTWQPSGQ